MAEYSPTAATRQSLINAAGALFAEHGIDGVTTREIASVAKENPGLIHYHFGSKDKLLEAVLDFATEIWHDDPVGRFLKENEKLFETVRGQRKLVYGLVDLLIDKFFNDKKPAWCGKLTLQVIQKDIPVSERVYGMCAVPILDAFHAAYVRITGDSDQAQTFCWSAMTIFPMHFISVYPTITERIYHSATIPRPVMSMLRKMTIKSSLVNLGLWDKSLEQEI